MNNFTKYVTEQDRQLMLRFVKQYKVAQEVLHLAFPHGRPKPSNDIGWLDRKKQLDEAEANIGALHARTNLLPDDVDPSWGQA